AVEAAPDLAPQTLANWVLGELQAARRHNPDGEDLEPEVLADVVTRVSDKSITNAAGREVLATLIASGGDPGEIIERLGLTSISSDGELEAIVETALAENAEAAERVKAGNAKAIGPIIGAVM